MTFRVRGPDRRRFDDGSRTGALDRRRGDRRRRGCDLEPLESRQLMAGDAFVGPLPDYSDPQTGYLAPGSGPSSQLRAVNLTAASSGSYSFEVVYRDDTGVRVASIDRYDVRVYGPNGYARTASLVSVDRAQDGKVRVARYKVAAPDGSWGARDNGRYRVELRRDQVFDVSGNAATDGIVGEFHVAIPGAGAPLPTPISFGVDVRDFGAVPNDGRDDSAAIQAAIDSLPPGDGVPIGSGPVGGIVLIPAGVWDLDRTLTLHSGVTLRGAGPATVLHDVQTDRNSSAIRLVSPFVHRFNIGVTVERLTIYTRWARGISIDPDMGGSVNDLRLADLRVSALGTAIDLHDRPVYHTDVENVEVYNPGGAALHIDGISYVNRVRNFSVTGRARNGFHSSQAIVRMAGDLLVQGMAITVTGAKTLPLEIRGRMTFNGLDLDVPAADCPGGFAVVMRDLTYGLFDSIKGVGAGRRLRLVDARDVQVAHMTSDGTSNVLSHLGSVNPRSYLRVGNAVNGRLQVVAPPATPAAHVPVPAPTNVIDAMLFGALPDDGVDDTAQIQAAIDSLPRGNGIPGSAAGQPVGGIVQLPLGMLNVSAPIKLPSGVWLRGHGNGTTLRNDVTGADRAVVELTSPYTHRSNVGAGLIDLGVFGAHAAGIRPDHTVENELRDLRLVGLRFYVNGPAIDLRTPDVNYAHVERVVVRDPGSTVIWLGREDNSGTGNSVRALRVAGHARPGFDAEKALFVYHGETRIEGGSIEDTFAAVLPFYGSGRLEMYGLYMEYPQQPDHLGFVFDGASGYVDNLWHVDPQRVLAFRNGSDMYFGNLNIDGYTVGLRECVSVDGTSRVTLNTVNAQFDAGMLDHPRVVVHGVYSTRAWRFVETAKAVGDGNLVSDPGMTDVADDRAANWTIEWGDQLGAIEGTWAVETVGGVRRLKIVVLSNPNHRKVSVRVNLTVPASAVGRPGVARWRVDGTGPAFVWQRYYAAEYPGRVTKSLTAVASPQPIRADEQVWIDLTDARGTYYISKVGFVAA